MDKLDQILDKINKIEIAIAGDERFGTKGLVHSNKEQEARIIELEKHKSYSEKTDAKRVGMAIGAGLVGGAGTHGLWQLIKNWF